MDAAANRGTDGQIVLRMLGEAAEWEGGLWGLTDGRELGVRRTHAVLARTVWLSTSTVCVCVCTVCMCVCVCVCVRHRSEENTSELQ